MAWYLVMQMEVHLVHLKVIERVLQMVPQKGVHLVTLKVILMAVWMVM